MRFILTLDVAVFGRLLMIIAFVLGRRKELTLLLVFVYARRKGL